MARAIVTQELVDSAASELIANGDEITTKSIQAQIGGGSFSTVKRYLDVWRERREKGDAPIANLPPEVEARGRELVAMLWGQASRLAQHEVQVVREEANAAVTSAQASLTEAHTEISRLERLEADQSEAVARSAARLRELELELAEAKVEARRVRELEASLASARGEVKNLQAEIAAQSGERGRLAGESEILKNQVRELMAMLRPKSGKSQP